MSLHTSPRIDFECKSQLTKYLVIYHLMVFVLIAFTYIFKDLTYPLSGQLVGPGRFDDWWKMLEVAKEYPQVSKYICTIPWVHVYTINFLNHLVGPLLSHVAYILISILTLVFPYVYLTRVAGKLNSILLIFTYPLIFSFWRGNTDFMIFGLTLSACLLFLEDRTKMSLVFFAIASSFKPFTLLFTMVFGWEKLLKNYLLIAIISIVFLGFILLGDGDFFEHLDSFRDCAKNYSDEYIQGDAGTLHNNSLWGLYKLLLNLIYHDTFVINKIVHKSMWLNSLSLIFIIFSFLYLKSRVVIFKDIVGTNIFLLSLLAVLFLPISPDYRLYLLSVSLITTSILEVVPDYRKDQIIIFLMILLLPKHLIWLRFETVNFTVNSAINALLILTALFYVWLKQRGFFRK